MTHPCDLRDKTIRWMAGVIGDLQKQVARLEKENAQMRDQLKPSRQKALAYAAGKRCS